VNPASLAARNGRHPLAGAKDLVRADTGSFGAKTGADAPQDDVDWEVVAPVALVLAALASVVAAAEAPQPSPSPTPTPGPRVDQQVEKVLDEKQRTEIPRFEASIEVVGQSPQAILERRLRGVELECGPAGGGPPTEAETRAVRPHLSPSADFLGLAKAIAAKLKGKGNPRYFLYLVRRTNDVTFIVREGRISDAEFYNTVGVTFELIEAFPDSKGASAALRRMERGFDTAVSEIAAAPVPPWSTSPCRPK
jgi:hypothetical protein